jgi:ABC-2 type transport system permease protein
MAVMYVVFGTIFGYEGPSYILYLLCGNILFNTLRGATQQSLTSLVNNRGLLTKNKIAYQVFPLSLNISAIVNFAFSYVALLIVMFFVNLTTPYMDPFSPSMLKVIAMLPAFFLFIYGMSLILSAAYVYFRDIMHFYTIFLTLWTYLTPIFYMTDRMGQGFLSQVFKIVLKLNPMVQFIEYFRNITYRQASLLTADAWYVPEIQRSVILNPTIWSLYGIGLSFFAIGTAVFTLTKRNFIYKI